MKKIILASVLFVAIALTACGKKDGVWYSKNWEKEHPNGQTNGPLTPCDTSAVVSYSATVQPIIAANCGTSNGGCHKSHGGAGASDYNSFAIVQTDALSGTFMQRINLPSTNSLHMPQNNLTTMVPCDTMKIRKWIHAGCPNN